MTVLFASVCYNMSTGLLLTRELQILHHCFPGCVHLGLFMVKLEDTLYRQSFCCHDSPRFTSLFESHKSCYACWLLSTPHQCRTDQNVIPCCFPFGWSVDKTVDAVIAVDHLQSESCCWPSLDAVPCIHILNVTLLNSYI